MPLTRSFKETVQARARRDAAFRTALLREGVDALLSGELGTGKAILRDYINATMGFEALATATADPVKIDYNGQSVDAFKVSITPFADDNSASKMQGYHKAEFTIVVSNQVPGYFVDLTSNFVSTSAAAPELKEHIKVVGMGETK